MTKSDMKPINLFATPDSMEALQSWIEAARDPMVTTAAMMLVMLLMRLLMLLILLTKLN